jgi:hypothetical protein
MTAKVVIAVLPHEERAELEEKIRLTLAARKPRDPLEHELIFHAVKLSWEIDRADRIATAHLAHKVRMAARLGSETGNVSAEEVKRVHDLGGRLFFVSAIGPGYDDTNPED